MLSDIWVSITDAICGHGRFYVSRLVRQQCAMPFDPDTFTANLNRLFVTGLLTGPSRLQGALLVSPSIRQLSLSGMLGSSVKAVKARVIHCRAEVEENG
jgi:fluoride ion exporter CrcB/FEX